MQTEIADASADVEHPPTATELVTASRPFDLGKLFLRVLVVAAGIFLGAVVALIIGVMTGLVPIC